MYKACTITTNLPQKMAATAPVEVGARGTVGSLVLQEIEYFSRLELDHRRSPKKKPQIRMTDRGSTGTSSRPKFSFLIMTSRKKKSVSSTFLPSICSMVEVADTNRPNGIPGFSYKNLKTDV
ncbi:PREDICTED: uncharacterized protein LOC104604977 [Nelumbo nucifera]|uniref:Uncharacterized protein LOC104604977 n=2 Tax=Nelumbo nucifera TaxID=4432 RepID=A0A1U8AJM5_NELNU|nr:PREDICTED: uncharacterized protein LOC104604977 [Nelumbo nucifera]DAD23343.1 TPA_asm: hypothetical protein HUJ06_024806 [Nelumbo nucifera]